MLPVIAIVGRPNVGKSTLFNRLIGERKALVDDRPGVTRDRHYGVAQWNDREVVLIDTGGFEPDLANLPEGDLFAAVRRQAEAAIDEADVVLFVVDRQSGLVPADQLTAEILRRRVGRRAEAGREAPHLLLVVNKCDAAAHEDEASEFWSLGLDEPICIAAEHGRGVFELWTELERRLPPPVEGAEVQGEVEGEIRIAVIGRPNIGKSTLVNRLTGEERSVVHDSPGTTMDAVDSVFEVEGQRFRIVDTAGVRRRARIDDRLESVATMVAIKTIERCHVTLLMLDGEEGPTTQDARLAALIQDRGRACMILINRWDLVKEDPERNSGVVEDELHETLPHLDWAPVLYISALTGKGCARILPMVRQVFEGFDTRVPTARLNRFLGEALAGHSPPQKNNHPVRIHYMTQARVRPPTFVLWSNSPDAVAPAYKRYLENQLRQSFGFLGSPLRIDVRKKRKPGEGAEEGE